MISPSLPGSRVYLPPSPERHRFPGVTLQLLDDAGMRWAQGLVTVLHYLHAPVDARCSIEGYSVQLYRRPMGALLFGRPEATRCGDWYGSVADVQSGRCEVTRWQVLNLARVFLLPLVQAGGALFGPQHVPGFVDRKGVWRSTLASEAVKAALERVVVDYLVARPPCFLEEPWELRWCLSYCDTRVHRGTLYKAAGFELYRTNRRGIQTWRKMLRPLTEAERAAVVAASRVNARSRRYRAERGARQMALEVA
jgi:hypothetical protein